MPFFGVGDSDQLLYRFTGAKPEILMHQLPELLPEIKTVKLHRNYRSTKTIVATQLRLIERNYDGNGGPYEQGLMKQLEARDEAEEGKRISFEMYDNPLEEASHLVDQIDQMIGNGNQPQDFFVASRTRAQLGYLEGHLVKAKIPFINITGGSFWNSKHVQDVIAYVRLAYDNGDNEAFAKVYDIGSNENEYAYTDKRGRFSKGDYSPKRWLGKQFLSACGGKYQNIYKALNHSDGWRWKRGIADLENMLHTVNLALAEGGLAFALQIVIEDCYRDYLIATDELQEKENSKLEDLQTVIEVAQGMDCEEFFNYVNECVDGAEAAKNGDWSEYVILSTVHRLKGLERPVMAGIGLCEGFDEDGPYGLLPHTYSMKQPPQFGVLPAGGMGRVVDERCLAFVMISRGKEQVMLSGVRNYQKMENMGPSRFVSEALGI